MYRTFHIGDLFYVENKDGTNYGKSDFGENGTYMLMYIGDGFRLSRKLNGFPTLNGTYAFESKTELTFGGFINLVGKVNRARPINSEEWIC